MIFRRSTEKDLDQMEAIANEGKALLKASGIPQWQRGTYPDRALFAKDIEEGIGYVVSEGGTVLSVCAVTFTDEESYRNLTEGSWLTPDGAPYATIHRCAVSAAHRGKHVAGFMFKSAAEFAKQHGAPGLRADTHPENLRMQRALESAGFKKCGRITLIGGDEDGDPRLGYEMPL